MWNMIDMTVSQLMANYYRAPTISTAPHLADVRLEKPIPSPSPPSDEFETSASHYQQTHPTRNISLLSPYHWLVLAHSTFSRTQQGFARRIGSDLKLAGVCPNQNI